MRTEWSQGKLHSVDSNLHASTWRSQWRDETNLPEQFRRHCDHLPRARDRDTASCGSNFRRGKAQKEILRSLLQTVLQLMSKLQQIIEKNEAIRTGRDATVDPGPISLKPNEATASGVQTSRGFETGSNTASPSSVTGPEGVGRSFNVTTPDGKTAMIGNALQASPYVDATRDGGVIFRAPVDGKTTPNSKYTRSELRETHLNGQEKNWSPFRGHHDLSGRLSIHSLPSAGKTTFAQIHGKNKNHPPVKLMFASNGGGAGQIFAEYRPANGSAVVRKTLLDNVRLGERFAYHMVVRNGQVSIQVKTARAGNSLAFSLSDGWKGTPFYFKAGAYNTGTPRSGSGASVVAYSGLKSVHA